MSVPCSLVVTCWEGLTSLLSCVLCFVTSPNVRAVNWFKPTVKYFTDRSKAVLLLWVFNGFFSVLDLYLLCLCARLFNCALWSPAGKELTSWLWFVVYNCEFVTFPLVSCVRLST